MNEKLYKYYNTVALYILLKQGYGDRCQNCAGTANLTFAHIKPTGLSGMSRGKNRRIRDIQKHTDAYRLLCKSCHYEFDTMRADNPSYSFLDYLLGLIPCAAPV